MRSAREALVARALGRPCYSGVAVDLPLSR